MNPEERDEDLLREYLKGDSAMSRLYRRDADEQPDAQLDARILAQARRGVARKSRVAHSPFARHWIVPTSLAAVLVLSLSVVLLMPDPALKPTVERDRVAEPARAPADDDAPKPAGTVQRREAASDAEKSTTGARAPDTLRRQSPAVDHRADQPAGQSVGQPVGQPVGKSSEKRKSVATERKGVVGGEAGSRSAAPAAGVAEEAAASAALRSLPEPVAEPVPAPRPMPADAVQADPAAWLRFIESLLNEQNRAGATSNLRAFRTRYPDFALPAALMPLAASLDAERP